MAALGDISLERQNEHHSKSGVHYRHARNESASLKDPQQTPTRKRKIFSKSRQTIHFLVVAMKMLMFLLVLATLVASKVSITTMLAHLRSMTNLVARGAAAVTDTTIETAFIKTAAGLYWQLLFILMVPNIITWGRALLNGVIGKSSSQPWPTIGAIIGVSMPHATLTAMNYMHVHDCMYSKLMSFYCTGHCFGSS